MRELTLNEITEVDGGIKISIGKLIGSMVVGALGGALRGVAGGPLVMIGGAIAGAGMGAFAVATYDAHEIYQENQNNILYL